MATCREGYIHSLNSVFRYVAFLVNSLKNISNFHRLFWCFNTMLCQLWWLKINFKILIIKWPVVTFCYCNAFLGVLFMYVCICVFSICCCHLLQGNLPEWTGDSDSWIRCPCSKYPQSSRIQRWHVPAKTLWDALDY